MIILVLLGTTLALTVVGLLAADQAHSFGAPRPIAAALGVLAIFTTWRKNP